MHFWDKNLLDRGLAQASDIEIWRYAAEREMILNSKDEDFYHLEVR